MQSDQSQATGALTSHKIAMCPNTFFQKSAMKAARLEAARQHLARKAYRGVAYNQIANGKPVTKAELVYRGVPYNFG